MTPIRLLMCALLLCACAEDVDTDDICATRLQPLTYDSWGQGFVRTHCTGCHSSIVAPEHRKGAPPTVDFNTYQGVINHADRMQTRVLSPDNKMPPAGGPTAEEKAMLEEWIQCSVLPDKAALAEDSS